MKIEGIQTIKKADLLGVILHSSGFWNVKSLSPLLLELRIKTYNGFNDSAFLPFSVLFPVVIQNFEKTVKIFEKILFLMYQSKAIISDLYDESFGSVFLADKVLTV